MSQELTQDDLDGWDGAQGPEIRVLADGLVWVTHSMVVIAQMPGRGKSRGRPGGRPRALPPRGKGG